MLRHLLLFALSLTLLAACQDTNTNSTTDVTDTEQPAVQPAVPQQSSSAPMKGDNYEVTVLDDKIKSPRKELSGTVGDVPLRINYGSPAVNERTIYGDLVPFGKVWRTGANEATRITFEKDVMVGDANKKLAAGTYALFTLPDNRNEWTVIFNKVADQWGAYDYDESADVARIKGTAKDAGTPYERMDFTLQGDAVKLMWDDLEIMFPVAAAGK